MQLIKKDELNRREFLRVSTIAGTGILISPYVKNFPNSSITNDLNVALIGAGAQGQVLLNACLKIPNIRFKAICDIWKDYNLKRSFRLLQKYGHDLNAYEDYREMLIKEKDLDAVIIATPDFWHERHAIDCLQAGLHVYLEKEMSNTLDGAKKIVNAVKRTGKLLQVGHQRRSNPNYIHCYNRIINDSKLLGRITTINGQWNRAVQPDNGWPKGSDIPVATLRKYGFDNMHQHRNWRWFRKLGGGPIVDLGSHQIDIYNWFLDSTPKSVIASGGIDYYDKSNHEWYDSVLATYKYETKFGVVRAFYQTITTNSNQGYFESFMGDEGSLVISESAGRVGIYKEPNSPNWDRWVELGIIETPVESKTQQATTLLDVRETVAPPKHTLPINFNDPYHQPHLENFFNTICGKDKLNCPADVAFESAVTVLKVNEAVKSKHEIKFNPSDFRA